MANFTSAQALINHRQAQLRRLKHGRTSIDAASKAAAEIAKMEAVTLTSGPTRAEGELARAGHPFRKQRLLSIGRKIKGGASAMSSYPLLPIGRKQNKVVRGWRIFRIREGVYRLQNIDPVSKFVLAPGGTKRMVSRQFWQEMNRRVVPKIRKARQELLRLALKG